MVSVANSLDNKAREQYPEDECPVEAWMPDTKPWYEIQDEAYVRGYVAETYIDKARCLFFEVRPVIEL